MHTYKLGSVATILWPQLHSQQFVDGQTDRRTEDVTAANSHAYRQKLVSVASIFWPQLHLQRFVDGQMDGIVHIGEASKICGQTHGRTEGHNDRRTDRVITIGLPHYMRGPNNADDHFILFL